MSSSKSELKRPIANQEKLKMLGELISGITHEINTPMHYLENNLTFLKISFKDLLLLYDKYQQMLHKVREKETIPETEWTNMENLEKEVEADYLRKEIVQALEQSLEGIDMVSRLVLALKDFSHPALHNYSLVDVNKCVDTACTISRHEWKRVADIQLNLARDLPYLFCSRDELHQVLLNLIVNAAHAVKNKIESGVIDRGNIEITTKLNNDTVEISVKDDGSGVPVDIQKKIFQPNFTTKKAGKGTGFGLSFIQKIVEQEHGGKIILDSDGSTGSTFTIIMPHRPNKGE